MRDSSNAISSHHGRSHPRHQRTRRGRCGSRQYLRKRTGITEAGYGMADEATGCDLEPLARSTFSRPQKGPFSRLGGVRFAATGFLGALFFAVLASAFFFAAGFLRCTPRPRSSVASSNFFSGAVIVRLKLSGRRENNASTSASHSSEGRAG